MTIPLIEKSFLIDDPGETGAVSGPKGCLVKIQDALKKPWPEVTPNPPLSQSVVEPLREVTEPVRMKVGV